MEILPLLIRKENNWKRSNYDRFVKKLHKVLKSVGEGVKADG